MYFLSVFCFLLTLTCASATQVHAQNKAIEEPSPAPSLSPSVSVNKKQVAIKKKIDRLHKLLEKDTDHLQVHFLIGKYYYALKDLDQALFHLQKTNANASISKNHTVESLLLQAQILAQKENYEEQIRILGILLTLLPNHVKTYMDIGHAYQKLEKPKEAIQHYRMALEKNKKYKNAYKGLWQILEAQKHFADMAIILEDFLKLFPKDQEGHAKLCQLNMRLGFLDESIVACRRAIDIDDLNPNNHVYLGLAHKRNEKKDQYKKIILMAGRQFKKSPLAQYEAGLLSEESHLWEVALGFYTHCHQANEKAITCLNKKADMEVKLGQYEQASQSLLTACRLNKFTAYHKIRDVMGQVRVQKKIKWYHHFKKMTQQCHIVGGHILKDPSEDPIVALSVEYKPPEEDPTQNTSSKKSTSSKKKPIDKKKASSNNSSK